MRPRRQETERVDTQLIQCSRSERRGKCHRSCHGCACLFLLRWSTGQPKNKASCRHRGWLIDYDFRASPWHLGCWHWHVSSTRPFASAQVALQYSFPSAGTQLQAGCAHLDAAFIGTPFVERILSFRKLCARNLLIALKHLQGSAPHSHLHAKTASHRRKQRSVPFCSF